MIERFAFTPEEGFLSGTAYPAEPDSEEAAREQLMRPHAQVREYINGTLLRALADSTAAGALGALFALACLVSCWMGLMFAFANERLFIYRFDTEWYIRLTRMFYPYC